MAGSRHGSRRTEPRPNPAGACHIQKTNVPELVVSPRDVSDPAMCDYRAVPSAVMAWNSQASGGSLVEVSDIHVVLVDTAVHTVKVNMMLFSKKTSREMLLRTAETLL